MNVLIELALHRIDEFCIGLILTYLLVNSNLQGTKMVFAGIKKPQERKDLIAYLQSTCSA